MRNFLLPNAFGETTHRLPNIGPDFFVVMDNSEASKRTGFPPQKISELKLLSVGFINYRERVTQ